jgi:hypothetical protein
VGEGDLAPSVDESQGLRKKKRKMKWKKKKRNRKMMTKRLLMWLMWMKWAKKREGTMMLCYYHL